MKTLKKQGEYVRVKDSEAEGKVKQGYQYCPKSEYKVNVLGKTAKATTNA